MSSHAWETLVSSQCAYNYFVPLFFILPLWLLCILIAIGLVFSSKYRFLTNYLILCSTGALIGCFIFGTLVLFGVTKVEGQHPSSTMALVFLITLIGAGSVGGVVGLTSGFFLARWLNRILGWMRSNEARIAR